MLNIRVEIKGDKRIIAQLKNVVESMKDWRPELQAVGDYLKSFYQDPVFETEGGIFNARWSPLSQPYQAIKSTKYPGRGILEASGAMRRSYIIKSFPTLLQLINTTEYAILHQEGRGVPERVLINIDDERRKQIVDIFKKGAIIKLQNAVKSS